MTDIDGDGEVGRRREEFRDSDERHDALCPLLPQVLPGDEDSYHGDGRYERQGVGRQPEVNRTPQAEAGVALATVLMHDQALQLRRVSTSERHRGRPRCLRALQCEQTAVYARATADSTAHYWYMYIRVDSLIRGILCPWRAPICDIYIPTSIIDLHV